MSFTPSKEFDEAADKVNRLSSKPADDELLTIYALFKQVTVGDLPPGEVAPKVYNLKAMAKYRARQAIVGKPREEAQKEYIDRVNKLVDKIGLQ